MSPSEFTPHSFITLSNCGGIEIMLNRSNDGVYYRFSYGQDNLQDEEIFEAEILYSIEEETEGDPYFIHEGFESFQTHYYLNEAMRINH